jgi:M6 family metalloprotease-like protein
MRRFICFLFVAGCVMPSRAVVWKFRPASASPGKPFRMSRNLEPAGRISSDFTDTLGVLGLMVEFQTDADESTTGDGRFLSGPADPAAVDPAPHDAAYFQNQLAALASYYSRVSGGKLAIVPRMHPEPFRVPHPMAFYAGTTDDEINRGLVWLLRDAVRAADSAGVRFSPYGCLVVFHAGVGRDIGLDYDSTPNDLPSAFLNETDLAEQLDGSELSAGGIPVEGGGFRIPGGVLLPETQSQEGYELGILGTAALMFGFRLGLPALWNTDTGASGIGRWGLMDQGSGNFDGLLPAEPCAFEKVRLGWEEPVEWTAGEGLRVACSAAADPRKVYKIPIGEQEYFLVENRNHDPDGNGAALGRDALGREIRFLPDGTIETQAPSAVIVSADEYDFGLPGSGILIWHVNEAVVSAGLDGNRVNADPRNRGVDLEEADGAQDIGESYGMFDAGAGSETGVMHDAWYADNEIHRLANQSDRVVFGPDTHPSTRSASGADTHLALSDFSAVDTVMFFSVRNDLAHAGFPRRFSGRSPRPPVWGDFDGDGKTEIAVADASGRLFAWRSDGSRLTGGGGESGSSQPDAAVWDGMITPGAGFTCDPVVADFNGDGADEIAVATDSSDIRVWSGRDGDGDGRADRVLRIPLDGEICRRLAAIRIDSGSPVLVAVTEQGMVAAFRPDGAPAWQMNIPPVGPASLCAFGSGTPDSLLVGWDDGALLLDPAGRTVWKVGTPLPSAATGRFDSRSGMEAVSRSEGTYQFFDASGSARSIVSELPWDQSGIAIADFNADGTPDFLVAGGNRLWAFNRNGSRIDNFPVYAPDTGLFPPTPAAGDVDGDGRIEFLCSAAGGRILAYGPDGKPTPGFPLAAAGNEPSSPVLLDLDGDGRMELASVSNAGTLDVWDMSGAATAESIPWGHPRHDPAGTGRSLMTPRSVSQDGDWLPEALAYNYPNPAYGERTTIRYRLGRPSSVVLEIYDLAGEAVAHLEGPGDGPADNEVDWDVRGVESGVYFCRVLAKAGGDSRTAVIRIAVVK